MSRPAVVRLAVPVADRIAAREALDAVRGRRVDLLLVVPPEALARLGAPYYRALEELLGQNLVMDVGEAPGLALECLRLGSRELLFRGPREVRLRLDAIARAQGGRVRGRLDRPLVRPSARIPLARRLERALLRAAGSG